MNYISWIVFIIVASYIFLKASELFLPEKNQESFRQALKSVEDEVCQKGPEGTALSPLFYMSLFLDKYLGKKLVSRRSIRIASIFATILVISTIWLINIPIDKGDFIKNSPFKLWNRGIETIEKIHIVNNMNLETGRPDDIENKKYMLKLEERGKWLIKVNHSGGAYTFSIVLLLSCFFSIIILSSLTLAITRQFLREMIDAKGLWTLISGFTVNVLLALILSSFFYLLLLFISSPSFWIMGDGLIKILMEYPLIAYSVSSIFALFILPGWIKLVVVVSIIPILLSALTLLLSALIYIFRKPIHLTVLHLFRRALEWKAGPISFFASLFSLFTIIIKLIIQ